MPWGPEARKIRSKAERGLISLASGVVGLLPRRPKQHVETVADDLGNGAVMGKHDVGHSGEIVIEKRPEHVRFERLNQCGETCVAREQCRDIPALSAEINGVGIAGKPLREIWGKIARERGVRALGLRLAPPCLLVVIWRKSPKSAAKARFCSSPMK